MTPEEFLQEWHNEKPTVTVHTSGSTGTPKQILVEKSRMIASAMATCDFLGLREGDTALLCLPVDFIAGKMMMVRTEVRGLRMDIVEPAGHPLTNTQDIPYDLVAMVPMQVFNSLSVENEREKLRKIKNLIIGGGHIDEALERELADFPNNVWSTYGMTETLSHIAMRRVNGEDACDLYEPFDGVSVSINDDRCLVIDAPAVCAEKVITNDIAEIAADGRHFKILGRRDNVICSGGLKIQIEEVERLVRSTADFQFMITKCADSKFGYVVAMLYVGITEETAIEACRKALPKHWMPRRFVEVDQLPLTATGKPARAEAMRLASQIS